jgi:hypothetical protein
LRNQLISFNFEKERQDKKQEEYVDLLVEEVAKIQPERFQNKIRSDLHKIFLMRDRKTILSFIRDGFLENETIKAIEKEKNNLNKSFILFLKDKEAFEDFYLVYDVNHHGKKWWNARDDYVETDQEITDEIADQLISEAKKHLEQEEDNKEFVSKRITIDEKEYIFAFYEDIAEEQFKIEDGRLETIFSNPVNKIAILYDKKYGFIKTYGDDNFVKGQMHKVVAKVIFNKDRIPENQENNKIYDLSFAFGELINNQAINFKIDHNSLITSITPTLIKLYSKETKRSFEIIGNKRKQGDLYEAIKDVVAVDKTSNNTLSFKELEPLWIGFVVSYRDPFDKDKITRKEIKMTCKNKINNVGDDDIDFEIMDMLRGSGLLKTKK